MEAEALGALLARTNATLNLSSGILLMIGWAFTRRGDVGILSSHIILAILIVPCVLRLLYLVWKERFQDHRRLARWVFPAWLYVSVTGVVVYVLLYHVYGFI